MTAERRPAPTFGRIAGALVGGYLLAAIAAALAVRVAYAGVPEQEISSGMAGFGMMLMYLVLFGGMTLAHSVALTWWLWGRVRLWRLALGAVPTALGSFVLGFFVMAASA